MQNYGKPEDVEIDDDNNNDAAAAATVAVWLFI